MMVGRLSYVTIISLLSACWGFCPNTGPSFRSLSQETFVVPYNKRWLTSFLRNSNKDEQNDQDDVFSSNLIDSLDLGQIIDDVARHTSTLRGYDAMLSLVQRKQPKIQDIKSEFHNNNRSDRYGDYQPYINRDIGKTKISYLTPIAKSLEDVIAEYAVVEEATLLLTSSSTTTSSDDDDVAAAVKLTYPPLYGEDSCPYDIGTIPQTDDDEWLYLPPHEYTAEHLLQAEQVIKRLLQIRQWSQQETIQNFTPKLAQIASNIDEDENILSSAYEEIVGIVEIVRFKALKDSMGKASYSVRIKDDNFPVLRILREKEEKLIKKGGKELDKDVVAIRNDIKETTVDIISGLAQKVIGASKSLDHALGIAARLDVIIAKAAYASSLNGVVPLVQSQGEILVENFLHPILLRSMGDNEGGVVPVDLRLSSETGERALIISGPNGGGKTLCTFLTLMKRLATTTNASQISSDCYLIVYILTFFSQSINSLNSYPSLLALSLTYSDEVIWIGIRINEVRYSHSDQGRWKDTKSRLF
jgi:hypothetical protein